jgi:hypothetical protein
MEMRGIEEVLRQAEQKCEQSTVDDVECSH